MRSEKWTWKLKTGILRSIPKQIQGKTTRILEESALRAASSACRHLPSVGQGNSKAVLAEQRAVARKCVPFERAACAETADDEVAAGDVTKTHCGKSVTYGLASVP